jgi:GNAT superfamily N-acetyltransferase
MGMQPPDQSFSTRLGQRALFSFIELQSSSPALDLSYYLAPWDRPFFPGNTATISSIQVRAEADAAGAFEVFRDWCARNSVVLVSCRLTQDQLSECGFLEAQGFRFIELNYRPTVRGLGGFTADPAISVQPAALSDAAEISSFAAQIFDTGRLHVDPKVGPEIGNRRYAAWASNAFRHPGQSVLKCMMANRIVAFMVVEQPTPTSRFWSLVGLAPGLTGQGLGRRIWQTVLALHHREGVEELSTSISSHNVAVHNLYVSLGFRFPAPAITLHWCPAGPVKGPVT